MRIALSLSAALAMAGSIACGGPTPPAPPQAPPAASAAASGSAAPAASSSATTAAKPAASTNKYEAAEAAPHDDPNEKEGPIVLDSLVAKGTPKTAFPKATVGDKECLAGGLSYTGKHKADYDTLVAKCGTPTGMLMYTKPAEGRLHAKHDKRDHFQFKVFKGMCYRYFAVADDGIADIDIIVMKKGALLAMDKTDHPIAVIDTEKLWCVDEDMDLDFAVEVDGRGAGHYTFGIWTRPK